MARPRFRIPSFVRLEHLVVRGNASRVRQTLEFRGRSSLQVILVAQVLIPRKRDQPLNPTVVPGYLPSAILHQAPIDRGTDRGGFPKSLVSCRDDGGWMADLRLPIIGVIRAVIRIHVRILFSQLG
jgi:hypothetical protein